ncbi:hypothetical protein LO80_09100 [Candidatus Francisella endociliophora]|uniref:DUF4440 domain-containing protein n=1 Tax=Candidatus Francisella endociliophora TaxID=653937 RepID=A0A097ERE1_9GAMM|nr:DUF4440 domain-containing protein [Francisella sp. FSC1006]AIT10112.1 hypothetical protein LO80_09100 [Francisella sp. FSC1006]
MTFLSQTLLDLEKSLLSSKTRFDYKYMSEILTNDFREFGKSGKAYTKQDILQSLLSPIKINLEIINNSFKVNLLEEHIILVTYMTINKYNNQKHNRSSIWVGLNNKWKIKFHQGTTIEG